MKQKLDPGHAKTCDCEWCHCSLVNEKTTFKEKRGSLCDIALNNHQKECGYGCPSCIEDFCDCDECNISDHFDKFVEQTIILNEKEVFFLKPMKLKLSNSRLGSHEKCQRHYYYRYNIGFYGEQTYKPYFAFGKDTHTIFDEVSVFEGKEKADYIRNSVNRMIVNISNDKRKDYDDRLFKLIAPMIAVFSKYTVLESEEWVEIEMFEEGELADDIVEFILKMLERHGKEGVYTGVFFGGYIDAYAVDKKGKKSIIDWKSSRYNREWSAGYIRQIQLYTYVKRHIGKQVDEGKNLYVEQNGYEFDVKVDPESCENTYDKVKDQFKSILEKKDDITKFPMINDEITCNACEYDLICHM